MAWTAPITFTAGSVLTFTQLNTYLRDNMLEMAPALGTTLGQYFVSDGINSLKTCLGTSARSATSVSTASTTYVNTGTVLSATATTGTQAQVMWSTRIENSATNDNAFASYAVSGASSNAASDGWSVSVDGITAANFCRLSQHTCDTSLTAGSNTFTMQHRAGGGGTATFQDRIVIVLPF